MRFLNSVKTLYAAVGMLVVTIGLGSYVDMRDEAMHASHLEISTGLERMVRLNQKLTSVLMIGAMEHSSLATATYESVGTALADTVRSVTELTRQQSFGREMAALREGSDKLRAMEADAIGLMRFYQWDEARRLLSSDRYVLAKQTYEIDSVIALAAVNGELAVVNQRFAKIKVVSLVMRIGALVLLVWVGIMFSRRAQADLAEQVRLRNEIAASYEALEERVRERTADLEEATGRLALENEERLRSEARTCLILNSAGEGIFGVDTEGRVTFFNTAAETILGHGAHEVNGREIHGIIHHSHADGTPYPQAECPMYLAFIRGEERHASGELFWRKDGSHFPCEYSVTPIANDKRGSSGAVIVFRDITERIDSQEELNRRLEELERFNRITMGREERMIQLKQEVNTLLEELGRENKYRVVEEDSLYQDGRNV